MRITGPGAVGSVGIRRRLRSKGNGGECFVVVRPSGEPGVAAVAPTNALAPVDTLIGLQEIEHELDARRQPARRGYALLDHLNDIRHGLLAGLIPRCSLRALVDATALPPDRRGSYKKRNSN